MNLPRDIRINMNQTFWEKYISTHLRHPTAIIDIDGHHPVIIAI